MLKAILISVIVGAIIGLFTNWLAIVMLFRPHREVRLFRMRVPFTPGLIPARQNDLADKLGEIVENDLVTPEGLAKSLKRPTVEYAVKRGAVRAIGDALQESPTLGALVQRFFGEQALAVTEQAIVSKAADYLRSETGREKIAGFADSLFDHLRGSLSSEDVRVELARGFAEPLHASLSNGSLVWRDALPESVRAYVEERLEAQVGSLLQQASGWLQEPEVVHAFAQMLQEKVENIPLIGPMAKGFLTPERVSADIVPRIQAVVESNRTEELVKSKMHGAVQSFWTRPVGHDLTQLSADDLTTLLDKLLGVLVDRSLAEQSSSQERFRSLVVNGLMAGANTRTVGDLVHRLVEALAAYDVRTTYISRTDDVDRLITKAWRFLRGQLIDGMPELLEALSIRQVVREQVASYPTKTLEKLVLAVANKELKMITWLGGLLGAVIGLLQAFLARM